MTRASSPGPASGSRPGPRPASRAGARSLRRAALDEDVAGHWARATIHLNLGHHDQAVEEGLAALQADRTFAVMPKPSGMVLQRVTAHRQVPPGWAFFAPAYGLYVINHSLWDQYLGTPSLARLGRRMQRLSAPCWQAFIHQDWPFLNQVSLNLPVEGLDDEN